LIWFEVGGCRSGLMVAVACAVGMAGCNFSPGAREVGKGSIQQEAGAIIRTDQGTEIFASMAAVTGQTCNGDTGTVTIQGTLTTTGSVDSAEIRASIDGGAETLLGIIDPEDFVHDGRVKTAAYTVAISLPSGTYSVALCFYQSGSQGREPKQTCAEALVVVVSCSSCRGTGFFGDLVGNPSLCRGNGPPHIPVHVKGDLGNAPALTITGPYGYTHQATMDRAGQSCVYQYNWDTAGNGGEGQYTFAVSGGGNSYSFNATLRCR